MNTVEGTCRFTIHQCTNLILPDNDMRWAYVIDDRKPRNWAKDDNTLFEMTNSKVDRATGQVVELSTTVLIDPDVLGNYAWVGNRAIATERYEIATGRHCFTFSVGVVELDGMTRPEDIINNMVVRGTGRYADISCSYDFATDGWAFDEMFSEKEEGALFSKVIFKANPDLDACDFPEWVKERLKSVYLPKLEAWIKELVDSKAKGQSAKTHFSNYPTGNPELHWDHWADYMGKTMYICQRCAEEVGFRKARKATFVQHPHRSWGYGPYHPLLCLCDEHKPASA